MPSQSAASARLAAFTALCLASPAAAEPVTMTCTSDHHDRGKQFEWMKEGLEFEVVLDLDARSMIWGEVPFAVVMATDDLVVVQGAAPHLISSSIMIERGTGRYDAAGVGWHGTFVDRGTCTRPF